MSEFPENGSGAGTACPPHSHFRLLLLALGLLASLACNALAPRASLAIATPTVPPTLTPAGAPAAALATTLWTAPTPALAAPTQAPAAFTPFPTHTPGAAPQVSPAGLEGSYRVQPGDTLAGLAGRFGLKPNEVLAANPGLQAIAGALTQTLPVELPLSLAAPPANYASPLVPDSEVVRSPAAAALDVRGYVLSQPGWLAGYSEVITPTQPARAGWQIVDEYARLYSISPRLILALLEHQSGALSNPNAEPWTREHGLGLSSPALDPGLSHQLGWAANQLNYGYYGWRAGTVTTFALSDGAARTADARLNAGTFAVARLLGLLYPSAGFAQATSAAGLPATFERLFGNAFAYAEPVVPGGLAQPPMQLPFEPGVVWTFTGGPHTGYGRTLPWAALDFGPPAEAPGCAPSAAWVTAVADGWVGHTGEGLLELEMGSGWTVVYLHLATADKLPAGTVVRAGDRLGHPSCEGGRSTASHIHLSRRYNGEWLAADGFAPFVLSGWVAHSGAGSYYGALTRGDQVVEACACSKATQRIALDP